MNTSEKFTPRFPQYFKVHFTENESLDFDVSSYPELYPELQKVYDLYPDFTANKINKIEMIKFNNHLGSDIEGDMIHIESLLDFSMQGLLPKAYDEAEGLIPLSCQLYELRSKIDAIINKVDKQRKFYDKNDKGGI